MLNLLFQNPILFLLWAISLIIAVTIHEFAHALAADKVGDPTARAYGRLTLNPLAHLDPIGTLMILVAGFGWGKPVPVDSYNFRNPKRDSLIVSAAGVVTNFVFAAICSIIIKIFPPLQTFGSVLIILNIGLGVFNLLPIPPLDGSKILISLLPGRQSYEWELFFDRYGWYLLIIFVIPLIGGQSLASLFITPIINFFLGIFL